MELAKQLFFSGTSGINLPVSRLEYPPEHQGKSRLEYYATFFNSMEINSTFYKLPQKSTVVRWRDSVPDNFRFTCKLSKTITHAKGLQFKQKDIDDFMSVAAHLGEKKGCVLVQFPPSVKFDLLDRVERLLEAMAETAYKTSWKLAVEFRDPSLYERELYELLEDYEATLVIHDIPKSATPMSDVNSDTIYLRFHGPEPRYRGNYADAHLKEYAGYITRWLHKKKTVYAYFNNTVGPAFQNLRTMNRFIEQV